MSLQVSKDLEERLNLARKEVCRLENWCIKKLRRLPDEKGPTNDLLYWRGYVNGLLYAYDKVKVEEDNQLNLFATGK